MVTRRIRSSVKSEDERAKGYVDGPRKDHDENLIEDFDRNRMLYAPIELYGVEVYVKVTKKN